LNKNTNVNLLFFLQSKWELSQCQVSGELDTTAILIDQLIPIDTNMHQ